MSGTPQKIRIGSRSSALAIKQVEEVLYLFKKSGIYFEYELKIFQTRGDHDKQTPLTASSIDNFFTDTLDEALRTEQIDLAVHSAKDVPQRLPPGLDLFALTPCLDETDSLVASRKLSELKSGSKIGASSLTRQEAIKAINPHVKVFDIRGTIEERMDLVKKETLDGVIIATCALKRLNLEQDITEIMPWETTALQGQLAIVGRSRDLKLKFMCHPLDVRSKYGRVVLVGAGPGDPELITLKAIKALEQAQCVFYDYLAHPDLLKYAPNAEKIYVGKRKAEHSLSQAQLSRMLREKAAQGQQVVRLKGGDPLIFGRGADEIQYLRSYHIQVSVVPGISSATGIPSLLGIPLTARGISSSVAFISGHEEDEKILPNRILQIPKVQTIVFFMGLTKLKIVVESLQQSGWSNETPVIIISRGTRQDQQIVTGTISNIEARLLSHKIEPPALIIVGETIEFYNQNNSAAPNILYLGTKPEKYAFLGQIIHFPMMDIIPTEFSQPQRDQIFSDFSRSEVIIFTSRFAVQYFVALLQDQKDLLSKLKTKIICAVIGRETEKVLNEFGIKARCVPSIETSQGLFEALNQQFELKGKKIILPRSSLPNPYLKQKLTENGAQVIEVTIYKNKKRTTIFPNLQDQSFAQVSHILVSSPSTVNYFLEIYHQIPQNWQIISKGPVTTQALSNVGYATTKIIELM